MTNASIVYSHRDEWDLLETLNLARLVFLMVFHFDTINWSKGQFVDDRIEITFATCGRVVNAPN
jgi:hypothetical protein